MNWVVDLDYDILIGFKQEPHLLVDFKGRLILLKADVLKLTHDVNVLQNSLAKLDVLFLGKHFLSQRWYALTHDVTENQALPN